MYLAWSPKTAFPHSEGSCLSDPWRSHWLQPSASSGAQNHQIIQDEKWAHWLIWLKVSDHALCGQRTCFFHSGWTLLQYILTMFLVCSLCRCSDACRASWNWQCRSCVNNFTDFFVFLFHHLCVMLSVSRMTMSMCRLVVPQRGREVGSASFCPRRLREGFCVDFWGRSSVHDPGSTHSQDSSPRDGRWSLWWT